MSVVILENVTKTYPNGFKAVDSVSIDIKSQELLILIGPSGCGKTTLLRTIAGLEEVSSGNIYIDNVKINDLSPRERNVAMVFQNYALYPHMTVYENMAFALKMKKIPDSTINKMVLDTASLLGIKDVLNCKPRLLSGGQQQRAALGRAIVRNPKVFLFDEPLSNLDDHMRAKMRTELSRLHTKLATTTIFVTHDQIAAMSMGEKIAVINAGKIQQIGVPQTIYNQPVNKFVASFFGTPPMNFFEGCVISEGNNLYFDTGKGLKLAIPSDRSYALSHYKGKKVFLGLRPEHITIKPSGSILGQSPKVVAYAEVVEPIGAETLVYFSSGKHDFVSRFESGVKFVTGQNLDTYFNMEKGIFFDYETEKSIF